jgi:hypothetical protein
MWIFGDTFKIITRYTPGKFHNIHGATCNYYELIYLTTGACYIQPEKNIELVALVSNQMVFKSNLKGKS